MTFRATPHLDRKHTVFGKLVGGEDVLDALEKLPLKNGTERPAKEVRIAEIKMCVLMQCTFGATMLILCRYQDPFEDYKGRLARKLARQAESGAENPADADSKTKDDVNWFGVKLGENGQSKEASGAAGVGKYLNIGSGAVKKRPLERSSALPVGEVDEDSKKKRKIGFGNFDSW